MEIVNDECYCCKIPPVLKMSKWEDHNHTLHLPKYHDPKICVFTAVVDYLACTKALRAKDKDKLFIITRRPFTPAVGVTVSGWVKTCMEQAGVDTTKYKTHSTRKASTSQAAAASMLLATILKAAGWASGSTFAQFYHLPVMDHSSFATAVLTPVTPSTHLNNQN